MFFFFFSGWSTTWIHQFFQVSPVSLCSSVWLIILFLLLHLGSLALINGKKSSNLNSLSVKELLTLAKWVSTTSQMSNDSYIVIAIDNLDSIWGENSCKMSCFFFFFWNVTTAICLYCSCWRGRAHSLRSTRDSSSAKKIWSGLYSMFGKSSSCKYEEDEVMPRDLKTDNVIISD